ncbi:MAG: EAL domain-containing protein [Proteobacteria bacterium]|nr:EAL domain-containing protein [Pseudomonadota bacterium]
MTVVSRRILLIDDDPTFRLLAQATLERAGFEVAMAGSVQEGLSAFSSFRPDLVLLDVELPGEDGYAACRAIRASGHADVPVILVTAHDDVQSIETGYEAGATDFVHKPVLWATLPYRINFMLRALDDRRSLSHSERKIRTLLEALPDSSVLVDRQGYITEHFTGTDSGARGSLVGSRLESAYPAALAEAVRNFMASIEAKEPTGRRTHEYADVRDGKKRWFEARFRPQPDGTLLIVTRDTTERRKAKARIEYMAFYDSLTRLPNRALFVREAAKSFEQVKAADGLAALLYLDLDRFKRINDNLGHAIGDDLLRVVADRLSRLARKGGPNGSWTIKVARFGGDEFVLLATGLMEEADATRLADELRLCLAEPIDCGSHQLVVTPSIGIAIYPRDSAEIDDLLVKADMAMYLAKDRGRNGHAYFGQSMAVRSLGRLAIETDMRAAFERAEFRLAFQPKLDLTTGVVTGVEALLRWDHPEKGTITPDRFIPVAEETGLIVPLGEWVLREACAQLHRWTLKGPRAPTVAVNVSVQQFERPDFVDMVLRVLKETGTDPSRLELEITESLLMRNVGETVSRMRRLRAQGVAIAIDDFGTGYSSLGYLRQLPVSALKIDRSFVKDLDRTDDGNAICAAIIALARELKLTVIAEGVETAEQLACLRRQGCNEAQGYLISRPVPAAELELLMNAGFDLNGPGSGARGPAEPVTAAAPARRHGHS